jgi:hypothetical protein
METPTHTAPPVALDRLVRRWLAAEYCDADLFEGWHLYIRDKDPKGGTMRNDDNTWGWLRSGSIRRDAVLRYLATLGITGKCDGTMEGGAYHQLSEKFPVGRRRRCGRKVGAVEILIDDYGRILPPNDQV